MSERSVSQPDSSVPPRRLAVAAVLLVAVFFGLRAAAWTQFSRTIYYTHPMLDALHYDQMARRVAGGRWQQERAFFMGPGYSYALGVGYSVLGIHPWVPRALNLACSLGTLVMAFWLGRRLGGTVAGFAAAALWALYRPALFFEQTILMEVMAGALGLAVVVAAAAWFSARQALSPEVERSTGGRSASPSSHSSSSSSRSYSSSRGTSSSSSSGSSSRSRASSKSAVAALGGRWRWGGLWFAVGAWMCGCLLGLAALARANILLFAPLLLGWIVWHGRRLDSASSCTGANPGASASGSSKGSRGTCVLRALVVSALFGLGVVLGVLPASIHNLRAESDFVPITSNAGFNLYIGNNEQARGYFVPPTGMDTEQDPSGARLAERALGRAGLSSAAISDWWSDRAKEWIRRNPGRFLLNTMRKVSLLFVAGEIPQIYHQPAMRGDLPFLRWPLVGFAMLFPLAVLGFVHGLRRDFTARPPVVLLLLYSASLLGSLLPFFVTGRYRLPAIPALCVAGGLGIAALADAWRAGAFRRLAVYGAVGVVLAAASVVGERLQPLEEPEVSKFESMHAALLIQAGRMEEAKALLERRAAVAPTPGVWSNLGMVYEAEPGGLARAAEAYRNAAALKPDDARIVFNLSQVLLRLGRHQEAGEALERTVALDPDVQPLAWFNLGVLRKMRGDRAGARRALEEYLKRQPGDVQALALLGEISRDAP